jgi:prolyl 4-hydroxylase
VPDFLTPLECSSLIHSGIGHFAPSPVVGSEEVLVVDKNAAKAAISSARTSTTIYLDRNDVPTLINKVVSLANIPAVTQCELPQVAQYLHGQKYDAHFDAFDVSTANGRSFCENGGQRIMTVLIYLNDVGTGGCTSFPHAEWDEKVKKACPQFVGNTDPVNENFVKVRPRAGTAVLFYPSGFQYDALGNRTAVLDPSALHQAEPAVDVKYVSQVWIRTGEYHGVPTRALDIKI